MKNVERSLGQANSTVAEVVHTVPLPEERVTQDGQGANGFREVHAHEGADARSLDFKSVVVGTNGEVVSAQGEGEVRQGIALVTVNRVLAGEALLGTDFLVTSE
ncbi:unnamed protein product [Aspergillus oryzae var. brunneus]|uniref:Unnamed protein product n=1 Tax=Aspergillus oryzae var. brunneus TaxID=332754 RepID=A0ABQ6LF51_ASPOZ|nr:unnamed protein product [Aspergillus oryzae]GMG54364.1 unnamed protein product [Aspergillus oryzae var. brunneus]